MLVWKEPFRTRGKAQRLGQEGPATLKDVCQFGMRTGRNFHVLSAHHAYARTSLNSTTATSSSSKASEGWGQMHDKWGQLT
jgi:hypothetical protein